MKSLLYLAMALLTLCLACEKTDEKYKDYAPGGEIVYAGKADSLKVYPGRERIELVWLLTTDATITSARVYWNNRKDSTNVLVKRTNGVDTIRLMLDKMNEGPYTFQVYNYNNRGDASIKTTINGDVYGDFYESTLLNRLIKTKTKVNNTLKLDWQDADPRAVGIKMYYKQPDGTDKTRFVPVTEKTTLLDVIPLNNTLEYHTLYKPLSAAIDTFSAARVSVNF
ncbi:DUF4998 domain-containing protein [Chitinophaga sedimenti]|uniref:DUF4998 domain-containing protein n=1 Tax=Chitinophaga sedimenti TaxID=2033606 RepID=UPI002002E9E0|nr:DUF4998 domain-containing protein [Chitinophaga sedimenti]MCK7558194.1 DUF4998 domain-containing protein [Chitinophaga sedimenti]